MPQASQELRTKINGHFGSGIDLYVPLEFLKSRGWVYDRGMLSAPKRQITEKEWDCVDFLCYEWDFGFTATGNDPINPGHCVGGQNITSEPCPKCGATMDDSCAYAKIIEAEQRGNKYLADANVAAEAGKHEKAEKLYAKGQFWIDRYNKLAGNI